MSNDADIRTIDVGGLATIETTVEFHWDRLGEHFMRAGSEQQADFLRGWLHAAEQLGYNATENQYLYIAEATGSSATRQAIASQLNSLADWLKTERTK